LDVLTKRFNSVEVTGNVVRPGIVSFDPDLTLGRLLEKSQGLKDDSYLKRIDIYRKVNDNERELVSVDYTVSASARIRLREFDLVRVYSKKDVSEVGNVSIVGQVKQPGTYVLLKNMRVLDLVYLAQLQNDASVQLIELVRQKPGGKTDVYPVPLADIRNNPKLSSNYLLQDRDQIFIRKDGDKGLIKKITLSGQVKFPGQYAIRPNDRISDVVARAGGFTGDAFLPGLRLQRVSVKLASEEGRVRVLEQERRALTYDYDRMQALATVAQKNYDGMLTVLSEKIGENSGRLMLSIKDPISYVHTRDDVVLENGDSITVPETPASIQIVGGVQLSISILYQPGARMNYYVERAGGFTKYADQGDSFIIRANGIVVKAGNQVIQEGDMIYVPERLVIPFNWLNAISQVAQTAFNVLSTLKILDVLK